MLKLSGKGKKKKEKEIIWKLNRRARSVNRAKYGKAGAVKRCIDGNGVPGKISKARCRREHSSILRGKSCIPWFYAGQPHPYRWIRLSGIHIIRVYMEYTIYHNCLSNNAPFFLSFILFSFDSLYRDSSPRRLTAEYIGVVVADRSNFAR